MDLLFWVVGIGLGVIVGGVVVACIILGAISAAIGRGLGW